MLSLHVERRSVAFPLNIVFAAYALIAVWLCGSAIERDWQQQRVASRSLAIASVNRDLFVAMQNLRTERGMVQMSQAGNDGLFLGTVIAGLRHLHHATLTVDRLRRSAADAAAGWAAQNRHTLERSRQVEMLAKMFEALVGDLAGGFSAVSSALEATAGSMSTTAEQANHQSANVLAATEQTSANV
jgi:hypothetical protein